MFSPDSKMPIGSGARSTGKAYLLGLLTGLLLPVAAEGVAWVFVRLGSTDTGGFLVGGGSDFQSRLATRLAGTSRGRITVDPHLGYGLEPAFESYGREGTESLRIVALGGSTTDPNHPGHWPGALSEILKGEGISARIFNGGVGGYSSSQEVIKLIRDALSLSPHLIISLSGVNDLGFIWSRSPATPTVNPHQDMIFEYLTTPHPVESRLLPNLARLVDGIWEEPRPPHWGYPAQLAPEEQWEKNVRIMQAVAAEFGIRYLCALQPIMGFGGYDPSPEEQPMWAKQRDRLVHGVPYPQALEAYYRDAQERCGRIPYCADLTGIFAGHRDLFRDPRHPNPRGYELIAQALFQELQSGGLLTPAEPPGDVSTEATR